MSLAVAFESAAALAGLLLGSFLNVLIYRLPRGESPVSPRSHCPACGYTLAARDNVPVLSWLWLRGRCRGCAAAIPWRYPAVEMAVALWFFVTAVMTRHALAVSTGLPTPDATPRLLLDGVSTAVLGFFLIGLAVIDWKTHTLPDALTLSGAATGFLLACGQAVFLETGEGDLHFTPRHSMRMQSPGSFAARGDVFFTGPEAVVLGRLAAIFAAAGLLLLIRAVYRSLRKREGIGLGDAKLLALIAAFLGFGDAFLTFFLGMIACSVYAVALLTRGKAQMATKLPLGSFLCGAGLVNALVGEALLTWYKGLL